MKTRLEVYLQHAIYQVKDSDKAVLTSVFPGRLPDRRHAAGMICQRHDLLTRHQVPHFARSI